MRFNAFDVLSAGVGSGSGEWSGNFSSCPGCNPFVTVLAPFTATNASSVTPCRLRSASAFRPDARHGRWAAPDPRSGLSSHASLYHPRPAFTGNAESSASTAPDAAPTCSPRSGAYLAP